jgi:catechol 2,3-dioxygenase-like lactoylglutathione lyase family enzyme
MLSHISLRVRDLERSQAFYDAALAPLGYVRLWRTDHLWAMAHTTQKLTKSWR